MRTALFRRTPLRAQGKRAAESRLARSRVFGDVLTREGWKCAGCGADSRAAPCSWHHTCGRAGSGMCLGAIADSAALTTCLCAECHRRVHAEPIGELAERLLRKAYIALGGNAEGLDCDASGWRLLIREFVREMGE